MGPTKRGRERVEFGYIFAAVCLLSALVISIGAQISDAPKIFQKHFRFVPLHPVTQEQQEMVDKILKEKAEVLIRSEQDWEEKRSSPYAAIVLSAKNALKKYGSEFKEARSVAKGRGFKVKKAEDYLTSPEVLSS